jgi:actin-related protein 9
VAEQARAKEIEVLDLIMVESRGNEVTLGKERHRFCDPRFDRDLLNFGDGPPPDERVSSEGDGMSMTLQDVAVATYVKGNFFVGSLSYVYCVLIYNGGIAQALQAHISSFILRNGDQHNEVRPKQIRIVRVLAEYREKGRLGSLPWFKHCSLSHYDFRLSLAVGAYPGRSPSTMEESLSPKQFTSLF